MFRTPKDKRTQGAVPKPSKHGYDTRSSRRNLNSEYELTGAEEGAIGGHPVNPALTFLRDQPLDLPPPTRRSTSPNTTTNLPGTDVHFKARSDEPDIRESLPTLPTFYELTDRPSHPNQRERPQSSLGIRYAPAEQKWRSHNRSSEFREAPGQRPVTHHPRAAQLSSDGNVWPAPLSRELRPDPLAPHNTPQRAVRQVARPVPRYRAWEERHSRSSSPLRKPPITSWNIIFTGECNLLTAQDFLFRIETMKKNQRLSDRDILSNIVLLLKGRAEDWYWDVFCREFPNPTWNIFKEQLINYFEPQKSDWAIMRSLCTLRQGSDTVEEFLRKINKLHNRMRRPLSEYELYQLAEEGLNMKLFNLIKPYRLRSLEELRQVATEIERRWLQHSRELPSRSIRSGVAEINDDLAPDFSQLELNNNDPAGPVEELNSRPAYSRPVVCWNCEQPGHLFNDCPEETRRLFCFRCGKPGVTTPKCPVCSVTGNGRRSGNPRPDLRSLPSPNQVTSTPRNSLTK